MLETFVQNCHGNLLSLNPESKLALAYLDSRGLTLSEIKEYNIGLTPRRLDAKKYDSDFSKFLGPNGFYLANRIIFPILNEKNKVKAIETRGLDKRIIPVLKPKYQDKFKDIINKLPESTVRFKKYYTEEANNTACFFGIPQNLKSIWEKEEVFLTEGIIDLITLSKYYKNCLATLTANINQTQINYLKRYVKTIIFNFDSDKAGRDNIYRIKKDYNNMFNIYEIKIHTCKDINEFYVKKGSLELKYLLDHQKQNII